MYFIMPGMSYQKVIFLTYICNKDYFASYANFLTGNVQRVCVNYMCVLQKYYWEIIGLGLFKL